MYAYTSGLFEESTARMKIVVIQHKKLDEESNDIGKCQIRRIFMYVYNITRNVIKYP